MSAPRLRVWFSLLVWWLAAQGSLLIVAELFGTTSTGWSLLPLILTGLLYLGCQMVEIPPAFRSIGLLLLGGAVGALLASWATVYWQRSGTSAVMLGAAITAVGLFLGGRQKNPSIGRRWWTAASWLYLLGWLVVGFFEASLHWRRAWASVGVVLFLALLSAWMPFKEGQEQPLDIPEAGSQLLLFSVNFTLSMLILVGA